jgi:hypothetical protein
MPLPVLEMAGSSKRGACGVASSNQAADGSTSAVSEGTGTKNKKAPTDAESPSKKKYAKSRGKNSASTAANTSSFMQVFVLKVHSGDIILLLERNGGPPFVYPTTTYLENHQDFMNHTLRLHHCMFKVDPYDPESQLEVVAPGNRRKRFPVLVSIVDSDDLGRNTPVNRRKLAEQFVAFFNHTENQRTYSYPTLAEYGGDITPQNEDNCPFLSQFLTVHDTMTVIQHALAGVEGLAHIGDLPTPNAVLQIEGVIEDYYSPNLHEKVRAKYSPNRPNTENRPTNRPDADPDNFRDLQPVNFE